jgi:hypothetical protein
MEALLHFQMKIVYLLIVKLDLINDNYSYFSRNCKIEVIF